MDKKYDVRRYELNFMDGKVSLYKTGTIALLVDTHNIKDITDYVTEIYTEHMKVLPEDMCFGITTKTLLAETITAFVNKEYKNSDGKIRATLQRNTIWEWEAILDSVLNALNNIYPNLNCPLNIQIVNSKFTFDVDSSDSEINGSIILVIKDTKSNCIYQFTIDFDRHLKTTITAEIGTLTFKKYKKVA